MVSRLANTQHRPFTIRRKCSRRFSHKHATFAHQLSWTRLLASVAFDSNAVRFEFIALVFFVSQRQSAPSCSETTHWNCWHGLLLRLIYPVYLSSLLLLIFFTSQRQSHAGKSAWHGLLLRLISSLFQCAVSMERQQPTASPLQQTPLLGHNDETGVLFL